MLAAIAVAGAVPLLTLTAAAPASAHGAPTNPLSRAAACGAEAGDTARSAACRAAVAASGTAVVDQWDNLRVANVAGRDREVIPDGKLCSGGIRTYRGLDLPRPDWPTTRLAAGADFTFTYRGTIPHKGTFRLYVTKDGYDPARWLRWSDLEAEPFLAVTDPTLRNGSYRFAGVLPKGKQGRHLIYTIWQNSDTPDTYYSCSDVEFTGSPGVEPLATGTPAPGSDPPSTERPATVPPSAGSPATVAPKPAAASEPISAPTLPLAAAGAGVLLLVAAVGALVRRPRP
jgi:chitin-binding protein